MDFQTQNKTPKSKDILQHARTAMSDMSTLISAIRAARSNVSRLLQLAPTDKPALVICGSERAEASLRAAKTELNLWIQKHFRGGDDWHDQHQEQEEEDHGDPHVIHFNEGHQHHMVVTAEGVVHECPVATCRHFSLVPTAMTPEFLEGHDETIEHANNGDVIWRCAQLRCLHFESGKGSDTVDA